MPTFLKQQISTTREHGAFRTKLIDKALSFAAIGAAVFLLASCGESEMTEQERQDAIATAVDNADSFAAEHADRLVDLAADDLADWVEDFGPDCMNAMNNAILNGTQQGYDFSLRAEGATYIKLACGGEILRERDAADLLVSYGLQAGFELQGAHANDMLDDFQIDAGERAVLKQELFEHYCNQTDFAADCIAAGLNDNGN